MLDVAVISRPVGRPPLKVKDTRIRLPIGVPERIDALCGPYRRAEFIRAAVEEALKRQEAEGVRGAVKRARAKPKGDE